MFTVAVLCTSPCISAAGLEPTEWRSQKHVAPEIPPIDAVSRGVSDAISTLQAKGVAIDTNKARRAAIQAVLSSFDPQARVLSTEEAVENGNVGNSAVLKSIGAVEKWPVKVSYVKFRSLYPAQGPEAAAELRSSTNGGMIGMIIDLRGVGGRGFDSVQSLAGVFVGEDRDIFRVLDLRGSELARYKSGAGPRIGIPVVVLVDTGTCDAAELLAAVARGGEEVLLVGQSTRGDTFVREKVVLGGGDVIYAGTRTVEASIGEKYWPGGLKPDVSVPVTHDAAPVKATNAVASVPVVVEARDEAAQMDELVKRTKGDAVLQRAADILMGLRTLNARELRL